MQSAWRAQVFLGNADGVEFGCAGKFSACDGFTDEANRFFGNDCLLVIHGDVVVAVVEEYLAHFLAADMMFDVIRASYS